MRRIKLGRLKTTKEDTYIDVELYYDKGGMNYFTGRETKRGYYLSASPVETSDGWTRYTAFSGIKEIISEASRFSKKRLEQLVDETPDKQKNDLVDLVLRQNGLSLETERISKETQIDS